MTPTGEQILACLRKVSDERASRSQDAALARHTALVKAYQHARFLQTYADLLTQDRYKGAVLFFLEELYGPDDFSSRDDQFARVVPALVRLFPRDIVSTVLTLAQLHALSEKLDSAMGRALADIRGGALSTGISSLTETPSESEYGRAWRQVAVPHDRDQQITLMLHVGEALDAYTRKQVLRQSLRLMRRPAQAAGLGALQRFLERGFDTFRQMQGADEFLRLIAQRERALAARLFSVRD